MTGMNQNLVIFEGEYGVLMVSVVWGILLVLGFPAS